MVARGDMTNSGNICQHLTIAIFLLCSSTSTHGKPLDGSAIKKRSVSEHQFMHDKGRSIQELQRRIWLNNVMGEIHTAESREVAERPPPRSAREPGLWPERPGVAVLLIKVGPNNSNNAGTRAAGREDSKPGATKHQNAKKNGRRKKQGKNSKRKAQRGREESRRHARSLEPQPGPGARPNPLPAGRLPL